MPITPADIVFRYSAPGAAAGGTTAGTAGQSLGKQVASNALATPSLNNLFPDVTGDENAAMNVDYQCVFVHNTHPTLTLIGPRLWFADLGLTATLKAVALDNIAASAFTASTAQASTIVDKNSAPSGVGSFSAPLTKAAGLTLGDLPPGSVRAVWVRRTATDSPPLNNDGATLRVQGDTLQ